MSSRPSLRSRSSYPRALICSMAFAHASPNPWNVAAYLISMTIPIFGFRRGSMRMSLNPSPASAFERIFQSDALRSSPNSNP